MSGGRYLAEGLEELRQTGAELGLHFNLTYGSPAERPAGARSPGRLLLRWMTACGGPTRARLAEDTSRELERQLGELEAAGVRARYLDGHHHVHLVPGVLRALGPVLAAHGILRVRLPWDPRLALSARFPLALLALGARGELRRQHLEYTAFVYPSTRLFADQGRLQRVLARNPEAEVIVHPADDDDHLLYEQPDSYTEGRVLEYRALGMLGLRLRAGEPA
jgi:predicted glycoside hydrolase/deacetylase ChbG (UPF0249 family)